MLLIGQTVLIYTIAGLWKAGGAMWQHGVALLYASQIGPYAGPISTWIAGHVVLAAAIGYAVVVCELTAPIAVLSPYRLPWIIAGIGFHVAAGASMYLIKLSALMIGLRLAMIRDDEYVRVTVAGKAAWRWIIRRVTAPAWARVATAARRAVRASATD